MRTTHTRLVSVALFTAAALVFTGCGWQMFENIQVKATPTYQVPGGTGRQLIADLEIFEEIEGDLAAEFDSTARPSHDPYTFRGRITPISVNVDDFLDETGINQTIPIDDVTFGGVDVGEIQIAGVSGEIAVSTTDESAPVPGLNVNAPDVTGFVSAKIGSGLFTVVVGDSSGTKLPEGNYTLDITISGEDESEVSDFATLNGSGTLSVEVDLNSLEIVNGGDIDVEVRLTWTNVETDTANIPVSADFSISEFSELVVDVGTDFLSGFGIDPVAIDEDLRRQVKDIALNTDTSEIVLRVTADLPTDLTIRLESEELFDGGTSNPQTILSNTTGEQVLTFPVDNVGPIEFRDPDDTEPLPPGIDSFTVGVDTEFEGYNEGTGHLTLTNVSTTESVNASLRDTSIDVALEVKSVTLRDINAFFDEFDEGLDADALSFLDNLPDWFEFMNVPLRFGIQGSVETGNPPTLDLTFTGYDAETGGGVVGTATISGVRIGDDGLSDTDLAPLLNQRPARIDIEIEATGDETSLTLSPGDSLEVVIEIDLVFAFAVNTGGDGDPANLLEQFLDEEAFAVEGDLFERESADDLEDVFTNLDSARLFVTIDNTSGLDGLSFKIDQPGPDGWTLADDDLDGDLVIELKQDDIRRIQTTWPFEPEVRLFLAEGQYELNYDGEIAVGLRFELTADIDYTFTVFGEDQ